MAMKKLEMEQHFQQYLSLIEKATTAEKRRDFKAAIRHAESSWEFLDGTLRHLGKAGHNSEIDAEGIHLVLKYAPLLFEHSALDRLENFLKGKRRILQAASSDVAADIEEARARMWRAHAIWDQLERQEKCKLNTLRLAFSGTDEQWTTIIRTWELMGVVASFSTNGIAFLKLATRMDELVVARCPNCGVNARLAKSVLLSAVQCGKCRKSEMFVQISDVPSLEA